MAYALAHKGKVMSDIAYNPKDPPSAYNNESVHSRLDGYTSMARVVHGPSTIRAPMTLMEKWS